MKKIILFIAIFFQINLVSFGFDTEENSTILVYEKINPAIVAIDVQHNLGIATGSGCIVTADGLILTSAHVVKEAKNIEVILSSGEVYPATVELILGLEKDLALIKINAKKQLPVVKFGNSEVIKVGQKVYAIGNPFGFSGTLTQGIISRIDYSKNKIQTDASINPGSSGGPLINSSGEVIGINQSIFNPDNNQSNIGIGFAIPINSAKEFLMLAKIDKKI